MTSNLASHSNTISTGGPSIGEDTDVGVSISTYLTQFGRYIFHSKVEGMRIEENPAYTRLQETIPCRDADRSQKAKKSSLGCARGLSSSHDTAAPLPSLLSMFPSLSLSLISNIQMYQTTRWPARFYNCLPANHCRESVIVALYYPPSALMDLTYPRT
jgi:hypothetical protein